VAYALVYPSLTGSIGVGIPIPNKMGNQVISRYRAGVVSLLIPSEMEILAIESVQN
jgi:hypothetical protein